MIKTGTTLAGRYEILEKIGSGGMADVYKANDRKMRREVAVKVLKQSLAADREFVERFETEGQAAASLSNPNIIGVYDVGNEGSIHYIVMELINGITLKEYIRRKGALTPRETMAISAQVSVGLRAAHARHIVHRDIKPQNIILSRDGKVKVTDFGIARTITDETKTVNNSTTLGSVHYIAPEQAKGQICDERSDIYSLGIVMYEMITGQVPFDKETSIAIALAHMNETMVPPSELNPDCPIALEQIIFRCTQKSRERRYHNCTELLQDLKIAVASPDFNFEKKEQENLMKSDTQVFPVGAAASAAAGASDGRTAAGAGAASATGPAAGRTATTIVDGNEKSFSGADADRRIDMTGYEEEDPEELSEESEAEDGEGGFADPSRELFEEDREEDEKSVFDRVIMIAGIVIGAVIICLILYIIMTLSGCTQKWKKTPTTESTTTTEAGSTEDTSETEDIVSLETVPEESYDPETDTIVPNVTGISLQAAIQMLSESDLEYQISSSIIYSDEYRIGTIAKQSYEEGTIVKKGSTIVITLSAGTDKFEIKESYVGGPLSVFKNDIKNFEDVIDVTYTKVNSDTVQTNYIISITPSSGIMESGSKIEVVYSAGPEFVTCPNVIGFTQSSASSALSNAGLIAGSLTYEYSNEYDEGIVMDQQYAAGTRLANGASVNLVVSKGYEMIQVPNVCGMTIDDAFVLLESQGFVVNAVEAYDSKETPGYVFEQDLEAESTARKGETINLKVCKEQEETSTEEEKGEPIPDIYNANKTEADDALKAAGYTAEFKTQSIDDPNLNNLVISVSPEVGTALKKGATVTVTIGQYQAPETPEATESSSEETTAETSSETPAETPAETPEETPAEDTVEP